MESDQAQGMAQAQNQPRDFEPWTYLELTAAFAWGQVPAARQNLPSSSGKQCNQTGTPSWCGIFLCCRLHPQQVYPVTAGAVPPMLNNTYCVFVAFFAEQVSHLLQHFLSLTAALSTSPVCPSV